MPWVEPTTTSAGSVLTATKWNQEVVGNSRALRGDFGLFRRTSGNLTLNSTSWSDLPTIGTGADITLAASAGDVVEATLFAFCGSEAVDAAFDVVTVVGSTRTNSLTTGGARPANHAAFASSGWYVQSGRNESVTGSVFYVLQAGDVSGGNVILRPQYATNTATNRTLYGTSTIPFQWYARNHGPVEV